MTLTEKINTIQGIPNEAFFYLGKAMAAQDKINDDLQLFGPSAVNRALLAIDYYYFDLYIQQFCKAMGWE